MCIMCTLSSHPALPDEAHKSNTILLGLLPISSARKKHRRRCSPVVPRHMGDMKTLEAKRKLIECFPSLWADSS